MAILLCLVSISFALDLIKELIHMPDFFTKSFPDPLVISELDSFRVKKYGNTPTVASKSEVGASTEPEPKITNQETVSYHVTRS